MRAAALLLLALAACGKRGVTEPLEAAVPPAEPEAAVSDVTESQAVEPLRVTMPGGELQVEFLPVTRADGTTFWMARTETTWEVFDLFFLRPDEEAEVDGITGPSKSVFPVTRGFGHDGMPALGMTFPSAQAFCTWLNGKELGRSFRLPTAEEWLLAAGAPPADWDAAAWHAGNADSVPHAVASKAPNALGFHDLGGNVAEWVVSGEEQPLALGGSWMQEPAQLGRDGRLQYDLSWQQRDPQWPKSVWWMSDAGWIGFRLVTDDGP